MFKKINLIFLIFLLTMPLCKAFALETKTHQDINGYVANMTFSNGFNLNTYLKDNLGLSGGIGEVVSENKKIEEWIKLGGKYEDKPPEWYSINYLRSVNHFHNPLLPWDQAYYTDWFSFCSVGHCPVSAILWAQGPQNIDSVYNPGGDWSWSQVRSYYLAALTSSIKTDRDTSFANTFRGMGQLMHLVQDMSVPEHTRNDGHVLKRGVII